MSLALNIKFKLFLKMTNINKINIYQTKKHRKQKTSEKSYDKFLDFFINTFLLTKKYNK